MKTSISKKFVAAAFLGLVAVSGSAFAAPVSYTTINDLDGSFSFQGGNGTINVSYSGASPVGIVTRPGISGAQNYESIGNEVKSIFNVNSFTGGDQVDSLGGGNTATFVTSVVYQYLAVHLGQGEIFFDFGAGGVAANTAFSLSSSGKGAGFSNFRAYSTNAVTPVTPGSTPTATPIPAAAWLFGSGLAGLLGFRRKSAQAA
jgi:hypothetical protein